MCTIRCIFYKECGHTLQQAGKDRCNYALQTGVECSGVLDTDHATEREGLCPPCAVKRYVHKKKDGGGSGSGSGSKKRRETKKPVKIIKYR